jgi:hypothetical protein
MRGKKLNKFTIICLVVLACAGVYRAFFMPDETEKVITDTEKKEKALSQKDIAEKQKINDSVLTKKISTVFLDSVLESAKFIGEVNFVSVDRMHGLMEFSMLDNSGMLATPYSFLFGIKKGEENENDSLLTGTEPPKTEKRLLVITDSSGYVSLFAKISGSSYIIWNPWKYRELTRFVVSKKLLQNKKNTASFKENVYEIRDKAIIPKENIKFKNGKIRLM